MTSLNNLREYIDNLPAAEKEEAVIYILNKLASDRLASGEKSALSLPDGTVIGFFHPTETPTSEEVSLMTDRARKLKPGSGRSVRSLLGRMEASDESGVEKYFKPQEKWDR